MTTPIEAVATALTGAGTFYPVGSVPASPAYPYGTYSATLGRADNYLLDRSEGLRWGLIVVQTFGRTADSALATAEAARSALVGHNLDISGYEATPIAADMDPAVVRDPDNEGVVAVTTTLSFTAIRAEETTP